MTNKIKIKCLSCNKPKAHILSECSCDKNKKAKWNNTVCKITHRRGKKYE